MAAELLSRIAKTTLDAFADARAAYVAQVETHAVFQDRMDAPVAAVTNGVNFWAVFATFLRERFAALDGVDRVPGTNPLLYLWQLDGHLLIQLKSDTGNLPVEQPEIPGVSETAGGSVEWVALTWDHDHLDRFAPAFVQTDNGREVWRIPVASIAQVAVDQIKPSTPRSSVSSARMPAAEGETTEQGS